MCAAALHELLLAPIAANTHAHARTQAIVATAARGSAADRDAAVACRGLRLCRRRVAALAVAGALTCGAALLLALWLPRLRRALYADCALEAAPFVELRLADGRRGVARVEAAALPGGGRLRVAAFQHARYVLQAGGGGGGAAGGASRAAAFVRVGHAAPEVAARLPAVAAALQSAAASAAATATVSAGCPFLFFADARARAAAAAVHGPNVMLVPVPPLWRALLGKDGLLHPFCLFQYASVAVWCFEEYYEYSAVILAITLATYALTSVGAHRTAKRLAALALARAPARVLLPRGGCNSGDGGSGDSAAAVPGGWEEAVVDSADLVPGDVLVVERGRAPCDCLLLAGEAVADEAMLTGEAVAVRKVALPAGDAAAAAAALAHVREARPQSVLFGGTTVELAIPPPLPLPLPGGGANSGGGAMLPRAPLAVVLNAGFASAKGGMLRQMLHPGGAAARALSFAPDALRFVGAMLLAGLAFYAWSAAALARMGTPVRGSGREGGGIYRGREGCCCCLRGGALPQALVELLAPALTLRPF